MKLQELVILLSCHGMEDFPIFHTGEDASGLLAAWSALWHPALLAGAGKLPQLYRTESPPDELAGRLIVVPKVSEAELAVGFAQRAANQGACVVRHKATRAEVLSVALADLEGGAGKASDDLVAEYLALGYCYLQVSILTRQMRYMDNLDVLQFQDVVIEGARAAADGDETTARERLADCYDMLRQSKEQAYPVDTYFVDVTLISPTTAGDKLRRQLDRQSTTNLLLPAAVLQTLQRQESETVAALVAALRRGAVEVAGGEEVEGRQSLWPLEAVLAGIHAGQQIYERILGGRLSVYGRHRSGLSATLPQLLSKCGFRGALHASFDGGRLPSAGQSKLLWEGVDGSEIDAVVQVPIDASRADSFLNLAEKISHSMDTDMVSTVTFAHWPEGACEWFDDLRRIAAHGPVLGRFATFSQYFDNADLPQERIQFSPDQYRTSFLKEAIIREEPDPISRHVRHHRRRAALDAARATTALAASLSLRDAGRSEQLDELARQIDRAEAATAAADSESADSAGLEQALDGQLQAAVEELAAALPRTEASPRPGCLLINPCTFNRRMLVECQALPALPEVAEGVYAAQDGPAGKRVVVDVPAMGYAWIESQPAEGVAAGRRKAELPLAEEGLLRNEFLEVRIDPATGSIRAVHDYRRRGNRLSQQLAFRRPGPRPKAGEIWRDPDETAIYSVMAADAVEVTSAGPAVGEIVSRGRLLDREGKTLAGFRQTTRLVKGSRVLELDIELDPQTQPLADPWDSYFCSRVAWSDATCDVFRGVMLGHHRCELQRIEAPHYVDLRDEDSRTTVLTGGLPYHKLSGMRMLDSLLVIRGETARRFRLGIGIDLKYPLAAALDLLAPTTLLEQNAPPPTVGPASWLFHLSVRHVEATWWEPLVENEQVVGVRARLLETLGRRARCLLSTFRPLVSARCTDYLGGTLKDHDPLPLEDGAARIELNAHEWVQIEARWQA